MRRGIGLLVGGLVALLCPLHLRVEAQTAFSPDSKTLATVNAKHAIELWDAATGALKKTLTGHETPPLGLAFAPSGQTLVSWNRDGEAILWDTSAGRLKQWLFREKISNSDGFPVAYAPDGKTVAVGTLGVEDIPNQSRRLVAGIRLSDTYSGTRQHVLKVEPYNPVNSLTFWPDHRLLTVACGYSTQLWDLRTGRRLWSVPGGLYASVLAISQDGRIAVVAGRPTVKAKPTTPANTPGHNPDPFTTPSTFPPVKRPFGWRGGGSGGFGGDSAERYNNPEVWDLRARRRLCFLVGHAYGVDNVLLSPDGKTIVSRGSQMEIRADTGMTVEEWKAWDTRSGRLLWEVRGGETSRERVISPDSRWLLGNGKIYDMRTGHLVQTLEQVPSDGADYLYSPHYSPDGQYIAAGFGAPTVWSAKTGKILWQHPSR